MNTLKERAAMLLLAAGERLAAAAAASWPRSLASREVERWVGDGFERGAPVVVEYLLSFDGPVSAATLGALQRAGFALGESSNVEGGFMTVRATMKLNAYALEWNALRLDRVVAPFEGYAAVIGPYRRPDIEPSVPTRAPSGAHNFGAA